MLIHSPPRTAAERKRLSRARGNGRQRGGLKPSTIAEGRRRFEEVMATAGRLAAAAQPPAAEQAGSDDAGGMHAFDPVI